MIEYERISEVRGLAIAVRAGGVNSVEIALLAAGALELIAALEQERVAHRAKLGDRAAELADALRARDAREEEIRGLQDDLDKTRGKLADARGLVARGASELFALASDHFAQAELLEVAMARATAAEAEAEAMDESRADAWAEVAEADGVLEDALKANRLERGDLRPLDAWHEDHGQVLWWSSEIDPVYIGGPLDDDWEPEWINDDGSEGRMAWWQPISEPTNVIGFPTAVSVIVDGEIWRRDTTGRWAPTGKEPRAPGCRCQLEIGDSACPVHPSPDDCPEHGADCDGEACCCSDKHRRGAG